MTAILHVIFLFSIDQIAVKLVRGDELQEKTSRTFEYPYQPHTNSGGKMLIFMADAFRHDYPSRKNLKGFAKLLSQSARAPAVMPIFPSETYPNMFSQVTGVYAQHHGIVDNNLFDRQHNMLFFASGSSTEQQGFPIDVKGENNFWWNFSTPFWISAEQAGLKTALYYWQGCQVEIEGFKSTYCLPYQSIVSKPWDEYENTYRNILTDTFNNFRDGLYDISMIYFEAVDHRGHGWGIDDPEFERALQVTDRLVDKMMELRITHGLESSVNIIIISDHGMNFPKVRNWVNMSDYMESAEDSVPFMRSGPIVQIFPNDFNSTYSNLKKAEEDGGVTVYAKGIDFKSEWNLEHNDRTPDILVVADEGFNINYFSSYFGGAGNHGYDPYVKGSGDMNGIFIASGPAFKRNHTLSHQLHMIDHYNVFCEIFGIRKSHCHGNNGSWDRVVDLFDDEFLKMDNYWSLLSIRFTDNSFSKPSNISLGIFLGIFLSLLLYSVAKRLPQSLIQAFGMNSR